jgi:hypothetical protein
MKDTRYRMIGNHLQAVNGVVVGTPVTEEGPQTTFAWRSFIDESVCYKKHQNIIDKYRDGDVDFDKKVDVLDKVLCKISDGTSVCLKSGDTEAECLIEL